MAGPSATGNYAQAGIATARENERLLQATLENSPNMGEIVQKAHIRQGKENIAAIRAEEKVSTAAINQYAATKTKKTLIDAEDNYKQSKRKAGILAAGGQLVGTGLAGLGQEKRKRRNVGEGSEFYDTRIASAKDSLAASEQALQDFRTSNTSSSSSVSSASSDSTTDSATSTPSIVDTPASGGTASPQFKDVVSMATKAGAKHPELVAAQWALESGYGKSPSGKNNYFGIKATGSEAGTSKGTWEVINGQEVNTTARFKDFASPQDSINDLTNKWYKDYNNYSGVNRANSAAEGADLLVQEGYATDPNYAAKLKRILADNGY